MRADQDINKCDQFYVFTGVLACRDDAGKTIGMENFTLLTLFCSIDFAPSAPISINDITLKTALPEPLCFSQELTEASVDLRFQDHLSRPTDQLFL